MDSPGVRWIEQSQTPLSTAYGNFELRAYRFDDGAAHAAVIAPGAEDAAPLVRLQSSCLTGSTFEAHLCDCRQQLQASLQLVAAEGGCVVYLDQEGRGHGLVEKVRHLALIAEGMNTYEAATARGVDADLRDYSQAAAIVHDVYGSTPVRLMTNNPHKLEALVDAGLMVYERVPIETPPTDSNRAYLEAKQAEGHLLSL